MLNQRNRLRARLTLGALMGVAAFLPTLTRAEALSFEEAAERLQVNSDRLAMTRLSVESAQLKATLIKSSRRVIYTLWMT